ncbi:MAG TPA: hypothetical protein VEX38_00780, partial [Fimbriimonadaceae bacterium]|nr:hypothetical protein [Fimbriimonadaceae bacterium]
MRGAFVLLGLFTGAALMCTACQPGDAQGARAIADYRLIEKACAAAGIPYPPPKLFIRAFKQERELEIWGAESERFHFLQTYPIVGVSGGPGPKRREGDRQIPEGVYHIDRFNPNSRFHLSLGLSYPNKADRLLGDPERPGSDIF